MKALASGLRKTLSFVRDAWLIIGVTLLLLLAIKCSIWLFHLWDYSFDSGRAQADTYAGASWPNDYYRQFDKSDQARWAPYVYFRRTPFQASFIRVDSQGLRRTWASPEATRPDAPVIFMFGGSTMWGTGARDEFTIPSLLAKDLAKAGIHAKVINFGESGRVSSMEVISLYLELRKGNAPDVVVFYDGVNDTFSAHQQGVAGLPQNEANRAREFNLLNPMNRAPLYEAFVEGLLSKGVADRVCLGRPERNRMSLHFLRSERQTATTASLPGQVVDLYRGNVRFVSALAKEYGFRTMFYWQPTAFDKHPLTNYEARKLDAVKILEVFFRDTYRAMQAHCKSPQRERNLRDISGMFSNAKRPLFVDWCHLGEEGNERVAARMAVDVLQMLKRKD